MSLLTDLRAPGSGRRQARREDRLAAEAERLRHLLTGAERLIQGLQQEAEERDERIAQLEANQVDAGVLQQQLTTSESAHRRLYSDYLAIKAELENAYAVTVPPAIRDTASPDDQQTEPIYVDTWRQWLAEQEAAKTTPQVLPLAEALGEAS